LFLPFYAVEKIPGFQSKIMPMYPENARKLGRTSKVILEAYIDAEGIVRMIRVVKSGGAEFDQAAIEALKQSRFSPARINGKPVPVKILVPYVFTL
jgi:protein TonB